MNTPTIYSIDDIRKFVDPKTLLLSNDAQIVRRDSIQNKYELFLEKIRRKYNDMSDYLLATYFNAKTSVDEVTKLLTASRGSVTDHDVLLTVNDFPYGNVRFDTHWTLWSLKPLTKSCILETCEEMFEEDENYVVFRNQLHKQSVPSLWHVHILSE